MNPKLKIRALIFGGLLVVGLVIAGWQGLSREAGSQKPEASKGDSASTTNYAFDVDTDKDELSDAKEYIFGTDPKNGDTDNDGYKDGSEVANGYDPSVAGSSRLTDRPNATLTVKYFTWAHSVKKLKDPQLDEVLLNEFFKINNLNRFVLPQPKASEIKAVAASSAAVQKYFEGISIITLPPQTQNYSALAAESFTGKAGTTAASIGLDILKTREQFAALDTPPQVLELQKQYLATLTVLAELFEDIALSQKDPVRVALNQQRGEWLVSELNRLEEMKNQIVSRI